MGKFKELNIDSLNQVLTEIEVPQRKLGEDFSLQDFWKLVIAKRHLTAAGFSENPFALDDFISNYICSSIPKRKGFTNGYGT
jgi:hypothetical protein